MKMGERIKDLRENRKMTQEELGKYLGVGRSAVLKYEKGEVENITRSGIIKMAEVFDVTPEYILAFSDDEKLRYMTDEMAKTHLIDKYGEEAFDLLDIFSGLGDKNKKKVLELCEDIKKSELYDSVKVMFRR